MKTLSDMIDGNFSAVDLPDDFLFKEVNFMFANDPTVKVLAERPALGEIAGSPFVMIDFEDNSLHCGAREFVEPYYVPEEDRRGVEAIYNYVKDYDRGKFRPMPEVPVAECGIPLNQYERVVQGYDLERTFAERGFVLYNPSVGCRMSLGKNFPVVLNDTSVEIDGEYFYSDFPSQGAKFFSPYRDSYEENVIAMQFNPFHPMAISLLHEFVWVSPTKVEGTYRYKSRDIRFHFDLQDTRFRVHSDVWMQMLQVGESTGYLEVFDLVASYHFAPSLELKENKRVVEPFVIEPLIVAEDGSPPFPYSHIGYSKVVRGMGAGSYIAPYSRAVFGSELGNCPAVEITDLVKVKSVSCFFIGKKSFKMKEKEPCDPHIFSKVAFYDGMTSFRFFRQLSSDEIGKIENGYCNDRLVFDFSYSDLKFLSFPRNTRGSLIYDIKCVTLLDVFDMWQKGEQIHEFLPLWSPFFPEVTNKREFEDHEHVCYEEKVIVDPDLFDRYISNRKGIITQFDLSYVHKFDIG